jgi:hypothetical protein
MENIVTRYPEIPAVVLGRAFDTWWSLIYPAVGLMIAFWIYVIWQRGKKRTTALKKIAAELHLRFFPTGDASLVKALDNFHLFSQGYSKKIRNMLHGENQNAELAIFDYRYTTGGGKHSSTSNQTVIYFRSPTLDLPHFAVRPEGVFHKIGGAFGYQDIDFQAHRQFSQMYLLRGNDEPRIRELFGEERIAFFESHPKISVEGADNQLVFYRRRKRSRPDEVRRFMDEDFRVFTLFGGSTGA